MQLVMTVCAIALLLAAKGVRVAVSARGTDKLDELAGLSGNILAVPILLHLLQKQQLLMPRQQRLWLKVLTDL